MTFLKFHEAVSAILGYAVLGEDDFQERILREQWEEGASPDTAALEVLRQTLHDMYGEE